MFVIFCSFSFCRVFCCLCLCRSRKNLLPSVFFYFFLFNYWTNFVLLSKRKLTFTNTSTSLLLFLLVFLHPLYPTCSAFDSAGSAHLRRLLPFSSFLIFAFYSLFFFPYRRFPLMLCDSISLPHPLLLRLLRYLASCNTALPRSGAKKEGLYENALRQTKCT